MHIFNYVYSRIPFLRLLYQKTRVKGISKFAKQNVDYLDDCRNNDTVQQDQYNTSKV